MNWRKIVLEKPENYSVCVVTDGKNIAFATYINTARFGSWHGLSGDIDEDDIKYWCYASELNIPNFGED